MGNKFNHARDFLAALVNSPNTEPWLKHIVSKVIAVNRELSEEEIIELKQLIISGENIELDHIHPVNNGTSKIRLKKLYHKSGVCALAPDQVIEFSNQMTLIYGTNGSGKSSYFRILNEVSGGNQPTPITPNIYNDTNEVIDVQIEYTKDDIPASYDWNGDIRGIEPFTFISVFDSRYSEKYLTKRTPGTTIVYPYGLQLFEFVATAIDRVGKSIESEVENKTKDLPIINQSSLSESLKHILNSRHYSDSQKTEIEKLYLMSDEDRLKLSTTQSELEKLKSTNYDDKLKILNTKKERIDNLITSIENLWTTLTDSTTIIAKNSKQLLEAEIQNIAVKNSINILNDISSTDAKEWKEFIAAGQKYSSSIGFNEEVCPYCRQSLSDEALNLISAYGVYLNDKSQANIETIQLERQNVFDRVDKLNVDAILLIFPEKLLEELTVEYNLNLDVRDVINKISKQRDEFLRCIEEKRDFFFNESESPLATVSNLKQISQDLERKVLDLCNEKKSREKKVKELEESAIPLLQHDFISSQKDKFILWFSEVDTIKHLQKSLSSLSTKSISNLSKQASQILITDTLRLLFKEELESLGLKQLEVNLQDSNRKGQMFMEVRLSKDCTLGTILSEGEQKGIALALFIAERRMQNDGNPIILDDPVNSLDHFIISKLIERLTKLDNQVIIFSHNILLQTALFNSGNTHSCGKNQISSCNKSNIHLFSYSVYSRGRNLKGVVSELKQDNAKNNLSRAKKLLEDTSLSDIQRITVILRHVIELIIDEKVLKGLTPLRFSGKKNSIQWERLATLNADVDMIGTLRTYYNRLSGGEIHVGVESEENPITFEEVMTIWNYLNDLYT